MPGRREVEIKNLAEVDALDNNKSKEFQEALAQIKENSKYMIEYIVYVAKTNRSYYEELLKQGFSQKEALELVKVQGLGLMPREK